MTQDPIRHAFLRQEKACSMLGSPFTARISRLHAERLDGDHPVGERILNWSGDPSPSADSVPLRIAGCLHALVLKGRDPKLQAVYPPQEAEDDRLWAEIDRAERTHADFILARMSSPPQTNEIRRSAALLPGFLFLAKRSGLPLVLTETGASAGLNLLWNRYRYGIGEHVFGDPSSSVAIMPDWQGEWPDHVPITIKDFAGCDLNPLDVKSEADRTRLLSYLWADQYDRIERTRAALAIAADSRLMIERTDAVEFLKKRLEAPWPGAMHVIFHTIMWQYMPKDAQKEGDRLIAEAGARASEDAPLARLSLEADENSDGAAISLTLWPGGETHPVGRADFHGRWVRWDGWPE